MFALEGGSWVSGEGDYGRRRGEAAAETWAECESERWRTERVSASVDTKKNETYFVGT
jgi:hypothetical protein